MPRRQNDVLSEIEREALDESKPVTGPLLKCLTLGGLARSADLRAWAKRELSGYDGSEEALPAYRRITAPLLMDGISGNYQVRGKSVSIIDLPEEVRGTIDPDEMPLISPIGKIQDLARQADSRGGFLQLGPPAAAELALWMTREVGRLQVERVYWSVSAAEFRSVVHGIRVALIDLMAEMRAGMAPGEQAPSPQLAEQALQVAVYGKKHRINITNAAASEGGTAIAAPQGSEPEEPGFWTTSRRIGAAITGLAIIVTAVAAVLALHPKF